MGTDTSRTLPSDTTSKVDSTHMNH
jgi:hypothetical protein